MAHPYDHAFCRAAWFHLRLRRLRRVSLHKRKSCIRTRYKGQARCHHRRPIGCRRPPRAQARNRWTANVSANASYCLPLLPRHRPRHLLPPRRHLLYPRHHRQRMHMHIGYHCRHHLRHSSHKGRDRGKAHHSRLHRYLCHHPRAFRLLRAKACSLIGILGGRADRSVIFFRTCLFSRLGCYRVNFFFSFLFFSSFSCMLLFPCR
jgi:hypothetical protein